MAQQGRGWSRRGPWALAAALLLAGGAGTGAAAQSGTRTIHVGLQAGGTLSWVTYAIGYFGIDRELGLRVNARTYASKDATRVALRSGDTQVVVDDFLEVTLLRSRGFDVTAVYPFSLLTGGVIVPTASEVRTVADLRGQTIGATSLTDKTLLLLRAYARAKAGFDPQTASRVASVASPVMEQFLSRGELQAALPFWHHGARMVGSGKYRQLISTGELLRGLGLKPNVPLLYLVARNDTDPETLRLFVKAALLAEERMKRDDGYWDAMLGEGLYTLPDRTQLPALRAQWAAGLPKGWGSGDLNNTLLLTRKMIEVAGPDVVGLNRLDTRAFNTKFRP